MGPWARWNLWAGVGAGGAVAALDLMGRGESAAATAVMVTAAVVLLELQYFALWAAVVLAAGWTGLVVRYEMNPGYWLVLLLAAPAIWIAMRCWGRPVAERARMAGLAAPVPWRERLVWSAESFDWASEAASTTGWLTLITVSQHLLSRNWGTGAVVGLALLGLAEGFRRRARWATGAAVVLVPVTLWVSTDWILTSLFAVSYLPIAGRAIWGKAKAR